MRCSTGGMIISSEGELPTLFIATIDTLASELVAIILKELFLIVFFFVLSQGKFRIRLYETPPKEASGRGFCKKIYEYFHRVYYIHFL